MRNAFCIPICYISQAKDSHCPIEKFSFLFSCSMFYFSLSFSFLFLTFLSFLFLHSHFAFFLQCFSSCNIIKITSLNANNIIHQNMNITYRSIIPKTCYKLFQNKITVTPKSQRPYSLVGRWDILSYSPSLYRV